MMSRGKNFSLNFDLRTIVFIFLETVEKIILGGKRKTMVIKL